MLNNCYSYLSKINIQKIKSLIKNPLLKHNERQKINYILYTHFENYAIKKAFIFKNYHKYKCLDISNEELIYCSKIGLYKSINNYNGINNIVNYMNIHINSELYKLITDKYSLSIIPKSYRKKNKNISSPSEIKKYNTQLQITLFSHYKSWKLDEIFINDEHILDKIINKHQLEDKLNDQTPFVKRIIYLKYYFKYPNILSNNHVAKLMCCSEETIRKHLIQLI